MARSAEQISTSWNNTPDETPICVPEELAPEHRELSFGQYLRRERVLRGITREEILRVTKVSPAYLTALEANHFEELPTRTYVVGFLRTISSYAGLEGDEVVNRFLTEVQQQEAFEEETRRGLSFWRRHFRAILGVLGAVSLLALIFAPLFRS